MYKSDWEKTGLLAVDLVSTAVTWHRDHMKPLKTIYLSPKMFVQFESWTRANLEAMGKHEEAASHIEKFEFDKVEIKMNSQLMGEKVYFDFWEVKTAEA